jgi:hypothetical protein
LAVLSVLALTACDKTPPDRPEWVIHSKLVFLSDDFSTEREPLALSEFRLVFPYIAGDIYGPPTVGDFLHPAIGADYQFQIDLNRTHELLLKSLAPTDFSLSYLHIEPREARVARLAPMMLQADGIEPVGRMDWFDPDSRRAVLLLYMDRAATISGRGGAGGRPLRYAIRADAAGYVWAGRQSNADEDVYTNIPRPARLLLAARLVVSDPPARGPHAIKDPLPPVIH